MLRSISPGKSGRAPLLEATSAVDTSGFSNITGQIIFSRVRDEFNNPAFLWQDLCETIPTTFLDGEIIPGIGGIGDQAEVVDEGQPYPNVGLNEEYVQTPRTTKRGFIVPVTREIIVADRTAILLKRASDTGRWLGLNKEKRVLDVALGVVNTYKRNGVATNTYLTSGAYVNKATNLLTDWRSVENAELLFDAITDPNTGEPIIMAGEMILVVPTALKRTAQRIVAATDVGMVDNQANATTFRTYGQNPLNGTSIKILSSAYVKNRTSSATNWFYGQPKRAFAYMEVWAIETLQAAQNSEAEFVNDVMMRYKVSERGAAASLEPRHMVEGTN